MRKRPLLARLPRLADWLLIVLCLAVPVATIAPHLVPVGLFKLALVAMAGVAGYWLDRSVFPYARPDGYLCLDWREGTNEPLLCADYAVAAGYEHVFAAAMLRRALIVAAAMIAIGLGA